MQKNTVLVGLRKRRLQRVGLAATGAQVRVDSNEEVEAVVGTAATGASPGDGDALRLVTAEHAGEAVHGARGIGEAVVAELQVEVAAGGRGHGDCVFIFFIDIRDAGCKVFGGEFAIPVFITSGVERHVSASFT